MDFMRWFVFAFIGLAAITNVINVCKCDEELFKETKSKVNQRGTRMLALAVQAAILWWLWHLE